MECIFEKITRLHALVDKHEQPSADLKPHTSSKEFQALLVSLHLLFRVAVLNEVLSHHLNELKADRSQIGPRRGSLSRQRSLF